MAGGFAITALSSVWAGAGNLQFSYNAAGFYASLSARGETAASAKNSRAQAMPLKLSLPRGEKLVVNGAVIKNDGPDVNLVFENQAHIMRQKDIMTLEEANSPARRIYLAIQCAYMFADRRDEHVSEFESLLGEFREAAPSSEEISDKIKKLADDGNLYGALKACRELIKYEAEILEHVQQ